MIQLASSYGRYGYRKVTALLREEGWWVNHKRIERLWRQEGLKVPPETTETKMFVAKRWLMRTAPPNPQGSRLEL